MRLDPTISWGDALVAASLVISGTLAFTHLSARVDVHDERISAIGTGTNGVHEELRQHVLQEASERVALRADIKADLAEIKASLNRLIERELTKQTKAP